MRRVSTKRQKLNREAEPWRDELRAQGYCDWCGADRDGLEIHEVAGGDTRALELDKPYSTVLVCRPCHDDLESMPSAHAICIGLALIRYRRPDSFSLEKFYLLMARRWPDEALVERWWRRMLAGKTTATAYVREFP